MSPRAPRPTAGSSPRRGAEALIVQGWPIELTAAGATAQPPPCAIEAEAAPWLRLNWWASGLELANGYIQWTTKDRPEFSADRRAYFSPAAATEPQATLPTRGSDGKIDLAHGETRTMLPMYRLPGWKGVITGLRIRFDNPGPAQLVIKSFHTACDTRHNINNSKLHPRLPRLFFLVRRFDIPPRPDRPRAHGHALHDAGVRHAGPQVRLHYLARPRGRSGVRYAGRKKVVVRGEGIGSNYWDLLPFGGEDALATVYYYNTLLDLAELEEQVTAHPQWNIATGADAFGPADLRQHAGEVKEYGGKRFWNAKTGRFGTVDLDGTLHDYGFTFLNNEAVYYNFATPEQANSIHAWLSGRRMVEGDTSTGPDIYHWRFGPRSTTRRNLDYYFWGWSDPKSIPWGYQVQDGGAVLGFSYHDLMARLKTAGPDDAWQRLRGPCLVRRGAVGRRLSRVLSGPVAGHHAGRQRARRTGARQGVLRVDPGAASHAVRFRGAAADGRRLHYRPAAPQRLERAVDHADSPARPCARPAHHGRDHRGNRSHS